MNEQLKNIQDFFKSNSMFKNLIWINIIVFVLVQVTFVIPRMFNENAFFLEYISQNENAGYYVSKLVKYILSTTADFGALIMRPWSIFTYMFTHMEVGHILSNLIFFFFFGKYLHQFLGDKKLLSTYILGGLAGWLLYALGFNFLPALTENGDSYMIGASASVMACVVAAATYAPNMKINLIIFQLEFKYLAAFYFIYDFAALGNLYNAGGHLSHLGGAIFGFVMIKQLQQGKDINRWFENGLDKFMGVFKRKTIMRVVHNAHKAPRASKAAGQSDEDYNYDKAQAQQKIDRILDKIASGGYSSLTKKEKEFLNKYSSR